MGRIEEIKEQIEFAEQKGANYGVTNDEARYLLSRLQIAEEALNFYADLKNYKLPNGYYVETTTFVTSDSGDRARKALDQKE